MNGPLLSRYRNPPFKPPTLVQQSPKPSRSPKRKRSSEDVMRHTTPPLQIDTSIAASLDSGDQFSGTASPRTKVSRQLEDLNIDPNTVGCGSASEQGTGLTTPRKRAKRNSEALMDVLVEVDGEEDGHGDRVVEESVGEVGETPHCRSPGRKVSSPLPIANVMASPQSQERSTKATTIRDANPATPKKQIPSEPPSSSPGLTSDSNSPLPSSDDLISVQASFTWREDEITGHEIDASGDDDGEGINGVGFRPTPAIAYARKQRRKQQVNEWKAREAREARQRRFERRRGTGSSPTGGSMVDVDEDGGLKRNVRFAGVD